MMRLRIAILFALAATLHSQDRRHSGTYIGTQNFEASHFIMQSGTTPPGSCVALKEFYNDTDASAGLRFLRCNSAGNGWVAIDGGGGTDHSQLNNLDYAHAGHTGFAQAIHASQHQNGGSDEIAVELAAAGAIPKADSNGVLGRSWIQVMTGDFGSGGLAGAVPAPAVGDAAKCLKGSATWGSCGSGADILTTIGQLITYDGGSSVPLDRGSDGTVLTSSDTTPLRLKWARPTFMLPSFVPLAMRQVNSCIAGPGVNWGPTQSPSCSTGTSTAPYAWAGLDFPDGSTNCANVSLMVPRQWNGSAASARLSYSRVSGTFTSSSRVRITIKSSYIEQSGGTNDQLSAPVFNPADTPDGTSLRLAVTDDRLEGTFSALNMTGAVTGYNAILQVCREGGHADDNTTDVVTRLYSLTVDWPLNLDLQ